MLGVAILLIMTPIAIKVICSKRQTNENDEEEEQENMGGENLHQYKRFENQLDDDTSKTINRTEE